ncbi:MAG: PEP-CTERM sorting domain-containing protein [Phycisphaerales bacterium]
MKTQATILALAAGAGLAGAQTIDFNALQHGEVVSTQYQASNGVTINAFNANQKFDYAVAFDSSLTGTADPDLEDPWSTGNLPGDTFMGNVLIIQENGIGIGDGIADVPDDEGGRPAGNITFGFDRGVTHLGFDVVDLEGFTAELSFIDFYKDGAFVGVIGFDQFESGGALDQGAIFGDNSLNRIAPLDLVDLFGVAPDRATFLLGGSMAIDNISYRSVPAPASAALMGLGGIACLRRRR